MLNPKTIEYSFLQAKTTSLSFSYYLTVETVSLLSILKDTENSVYKYAKENRNKVMHTIILTIRDHGKKHI